MKALFSYLPLILFADCENFKDMSLFLHEGEMNSCEGHIKKFSAVKVCGNEEMATRCCDTCARIKDPDPSEFFNRVEYLKYK